MPTDQPSHAPDDLPAAAGPPPLEVEGGAPRGPDGNSPIDPGMPPTDADGAATAEARDVAGRAGVPEPQPRAQ